MHRCNDYTLCQQEKQSNVRSLAALFFAAVSTIAIGQTKLISLVNNTPYDLKLRYVIGHGNLDPMKDKIDRLSSLDINASSDDNMPIRAVIQLADYDINLAFSNGITQITNCTIMDQLYKNPKAMISCEIEYASKANQSKISFTPIN